MSVASSPQPSPEFAYAPGDVIASKYLLEALLGEGGMGAVFRARNTVIDMPVAIKLIRADLNRELLSGRLLQEARAAAKLSHPAIVRVFDVGQTEHGDPFIVMELLEGETLSALIDADGSLTATRAVQLLLPIADALSAAHAKGFVHRDVKPDNVFVVMDEGALQPKLVDFGIVKLDHHDGNSQLTQVGAVMGSPEYMSPEQARGLDDIDLRADVWSFSIVLYEAIAGVTPFEHDNYNALLRMIVEDEPVTLKERCDTDDDLSRIVARGLSKDRADRFPSLGQMGKALAAWLRDQGVADDACGVSLDSKWLTRQTDPVAASRSSRPSVPEWFEATSGIRSVGRRFGNAPTVPVTTPAPASPAPASVLPPSRRRWLIAGAAALLFVPAVWLALASSPPPAESAKGAPPKALDAQVTPEPPTSSPSSVEAPAPALTTDGEAARAATEKPAQERQRAPAGANKRSERAPQEVQPATPPSAEPPKSDLIAPY